MSLSAQILIVNLQSQLIETKKSQSTEFINTRNGWLTKLIAQLQEYDTAELKILHNEHLAQGGKMAAIRELGEKFVPTTAWLKNLSTKHQKEDEGFRTRLFDVKSPIENDLVREMRRQEIRRPLARQNQAERDVAFYRAAEQDNDEMLDAMLSSPTGPMVSDGERTRALDARAQRRQPQVYEAYQQNQLLLEYVHMLQELLGRRLHAIGVGVEAIRSSLGDRIANALAVQQTGIQPQPELAGVK